MGRKYNQDEINDILGDLGGVTQKNYTAPTVKSNVAPAMAVVAQQPRTVQPTVTMNTQPIQQTEVQTNKTSVEQNQTPSTPKINNEGYEETNEKYGDYKYQDYLNKKDYKIYRKDGKAYYYDEKNNRYVDMDEQTMTSPEEDKRQHKIAVENGFVDKKTYKNGEQVRPSKIADRVALNSFGLSKEEKEKYSKSLIRQEKDRDKEISYVRRGGAGLAGFSGELQNVGKNVENIAIDPLRRAPSSYQYGKLTQDLSNAYYNQLIGKDNGESIDEINRKLAIFNQFNKDVTGSGNQLDQYFRNLPNEISGIASGIKGGGVFGAVGALGGGAIGLLGAKDPATTLALAEQGAKLLGGAGYVKGQAENTFRLEAGAQYQALLEMGVPEDIARQEALKVGTANALIESGESILDLVTLGKSSLALDKLKDGLIKKYGVDFVKNLGTSYITNVLSEGAEETAQEGVSIASERSAAKKAGIERDNSQDLSRLGQSALSGAFGAAISGGATRMLGSTANTFGTTALNNLTNRINERQQTMAISDAARQQNTQKTIQEPVVTQQSVDNTKQIDYNNGINEREGALNGREISGTNETGINQEINREQSTNDSRTSGEGDGGVRVLNETKDYKQVKDNIDNLKATHKRGAFFDSYTEDEFKTFKTYQTPDGKSSISVKPDGDITALVSEGKKGMATDLLMKARENGGTKMDCYGKFLKELYEQHGFKAVARVHYGRGYNEQMDNYIDNAIKEGKAKDDSDFDIYFMMKNNDDIDTVRNNIGKYETTNIEDLPYMDYDEAYKFRDGQLEQQGSGEGQTNAIVKSDGKVIAAPIEKQKTKFVEKNGKYTKQDVLDTAEKIKKSFNNETLTNKKGKKISNFYSNITEKSQFIEPETREKLKSEKDLKFYKDVTNEQSLNEAVEKIGTTPSSQSKALHEFLNKQDQFTATDMAEGWVFLKQYQDAGNYDAMAQVAKKMREMGTKSGQAIQMLSLEARLTPEGMYRFAVNELAEAEQKFNSEKGRTKEEIDRYRDNFQLTPEETEFIKTQMEKVQGMEPGRERDIEVAKINKMLSDKLPHTRGRSLKAWMRISMLFNPKTQVRNVMGNALITPINALADVAAGVADKAVSKTTGARTIGGPSLGGLAAYGKGAVKGFKQATQDYRLGLDTKNINQNRFDIGQGKAFNEQHKGPFKNTRNSVAKGLNNINDLLGYVMDAGDRMFYQGSVENSLYNQQRLNNTQDVTQEMADIAVNEGLQRTWNDDNQFTKAVLNIRRAINDIGGLMHIKVGEYGLGDLMIPFAKTPANLTKAIVDYSPVGFLNAITEGKDLKRAIATGNYTMQQQHDFSQTVGKAFAGSLLYILGTALAKAKISSGSGDEDKDLKNFMRYNLGIQPYSIKIGDKSFTYDWAQPVAAPLAITADIEKGIDENMTPAQALQQFLTTGFNVLSEQSFLSGVNDVLNNNDGVLQGIEQQVMNMPATAVPTLLKQFTDIIDPTKRQTYSKEGMAEQTKKYAMSKIPSESKKLAPQVDVLGNEIQKYGGDNSAFNIFLNPANTEKGKSSDVSKEIYSLYEATGNKNIIPKKVDYSITIDGEKRALTTEEMARWQKASGRYVTENVRKAINDEDYKKLSDEQKASVINGIVNYSYMKAKSDVFGTKLSSYYSGPSNAEKKGIPMYDYYISKVKKG